MYQRRHATETTLDPTVRRTWKFSPTVRDTFPGIPAGPWDDEPDKIQWVDRATNLDALMLRNHTGAWCGYVGVGRKHPLHGLDYDMLNLDVHGGLTFADRCAPGEPIDGICHIAEPGREPEPWWLGFDCGHWNDAQPIHYLLEVKYRLGVDGGEYRTEQYVINECTSLARQLAGCQLPGPVRTVVT